MCMCSFLAVAVVSVFTVSGINWFKNCSSSALGTLCYRGSNFAALTFTFRILCQEHKMSVWINFIKTCYLQSKQLLMFSGRKYKTVHLRSLW